MPDTLSANLHTLIPALGGVRTVARALDMSPSTISRWQRGLQRPSQGAIEALARLADLDPATLHYGNVLAESPT